MSKKQKTTSDKLKDFYKNKLHDWGIKSKNGYKPYKPSDVVKVDLGPHSSVVVRKGLESVGEWFIFALVFVMGVGLVALSSKISYQRFTMFNPMSSERLEEFILPLHAQPIAEEIDKAQDQLFGRTLLLAVFFITLGYWWGQAQITGVTDNFKRYIWLWCLGLLVCGLACHFYASYTWLHWVSYLLFVLAGLSFIYGLKFLFGYKREVGEWKAIGREAIWRS